jgi:hypothetical protein
MPWRRPDNEAMIGPMPGIVASRPVASPLEQWGALAEPAQGFQGATSETLRMLGGVQRCHVHTGISPRRKCGEGAVCKIAHRRDTDPELARAIAEIETELGTG